MEPELVIFDCDGVLVDSEPISVAVLIDTIARTGTVLEPSVVYDRFLGKSMTSIADMLKTDFGVVLSDELVARLRAELFERFRRELRPVPHVAQALASLQQNYCVASSSQMDRIRLSLEICGLLPLVGEDIYSASMVASGKPAPDLFLLAANRMGVDPSRCLVIEDSPPGIEAARAAGMRVFAFQGASHAGLPNLRKAISSLGPDRVFDDMRQLRDMLRPERAARPGKPAPQYLCAVDVGTSSARAGIFDLSGRMLGRASSPITTWQLSDRQAEHDSEDIWQAVCASVRSARETADIGAEQICGIGFDATCSLVVRNGNGQSLAVSEGGHDTIAWHDHRAEAEARECTATRSSVMMHVGSVMSPEMQMPKLMWLKRNMRQTWAEAGLIGDLADFLTWKASGSKTRSQGTLASKWAYQPQRGQGWDQDFLDMIGLPDLKARAGLAEKVLPVGAHVGRLSERSARELGLSAKCAVGAGMIDAHAGALGLIGPASAGDTEGGTHLALIAGTSNCIASLSRDPLRFAGVWGPVLGAALSDRWLSEAGQSATGALLDHLVRLHVAGGEPTRDMHKRIVDRLTELRAREGHDLSPRLNVVPDFNGNRSPLADPAARGVISGLGLDAGFDGLCRLYWRTCVGIAMGVRHMIDEMASAGHRPRLLHVAGGHVRNPLLLQLYCDATGLELRVLQDADAVLLGTAMTAGFAAGLHATLADSARAMQQPDYALRPDPQARARVDRDYRVFRTMLRHRQEIDAMAAEPV